MATEEVEGVVDEAKDAVGNGGGSGAKVLSALTSKEVLLPAALSAAGAVAVAKGMAEGARKAFTGDGKDD
jgi:hypothetical protein